MRQIGTIRMHMPSGRPSSISVSVIDSGAIDIHMSRTAEGEALLRLPRFSARELGKLLLEASEATVLTSPEGTKT
jgi:hypothetical protein